MPRLALLATLTFAATVTGAPVTRPYSELKAAAAAERGRQLFNQNKFDEAVAQCDTAIRLDPNNAWAFYLRGCTHAKKLDWVRALSDYDHAIRLAPAVAELYCGRAGIWGELGEYERGLRDVDEAARLEPRSAVVIRQRGAIHAQKGNGKPRSNVSMKLSHSTRRIPTSITCAEWCGGIKVIISGRWATSTKPSNFTPGTCLPSPTVG